MIPFLLRRLGLMLVTLAGVIVITFVLFNIVGGSPAKMVLGEKASPEQLEDFETVRGLNKPLFFGHWIRTRAVEDLSAGVPSGRWDGVETTEEGFVLGAGNVLDVPLAFPLQTGEVYRLSMTFSTGSDAVLHVGDSTADIPGKVSGQALKEFRFTASPRSHPLRIAAGDAPLNLYEVQLRRENPNPWDSQFAFFLKQIATFDFGTSHFSKQNVSTMLMDGIGPTLMLAVPILVGGLISSIVLSLICAYWRDRWPDRVLVFLSVALMSINFLVWIVAGQYVLAYRWQWFPVWGFESWSYLVLPVLIGIVSGLGQDVRLYRTVMLDEMYRDYVRTARAKGCSTPALLFRHVLRNALIPIITNLSMILPFLYTGSLLLETYFGIPGLGYLSINGIFNRDIDVVRAVVLIGSVLYMLCNLGADLLYAVVDPRVKIR